MLVESFQLVARRGRQIFSFLLHPKSFVKFVVELGTMLYNITTNLISHTFGNSKTTIFSILTISAIVGKSHIVQVST